MSLSYLLAVMRDKATADGWSWRKDCSKKLQRWVFDLLSPSPKNVHFPMSSSEDLMVVSRVVELRGMKVLLARPCECKDTEDSSRICTNYTGPPAGCCRITIESIDAVGATRDMVVVMVEDIRKA